MPLSLSVLIITVLALYGMFIGVSRILTGMHSIVDVLGGALLGTAMVVVHWGWGMSAMEGWLANAPMSMPIYAVGGGLLAVAAVPDPSRPCPCWEDMIASVGAVVGALVGSWRHGVRDIVVERANGVVVEGVEQLSWTAVFIRLLIGVTVIYFWRHFMKRFCYRLLPIIYQSWGITPLSPTFKPEMPPQSPDQLTPTIYKLPRWQVKSVTSMIIYAGIGWWATDGMLVLCQLIGI
ncbi:hypothetical protein HK104_009092 [Borealophlyctis nickersoniae]|nr:hypothetical protein HK104_009092 [Borealophlyctis nickersoniae]